MLALMRDPLRRLARTLAGWPFLGRFVRIGVAVIRLPEIRHRQHMFETEQLPTLLHTLSELNHRQLASNSAQENLVNSLPVALRKITRDLIDLRGQLARVSHALEEHRSETQRELARVSRTVQELAGRVELVQRTMDARDPTAR